MSDIPSGQPTPSRQVLVVDDAPAIVRTLRAMLTRLGYSVDVAVDAREALDRFKPGKYDLVITDYSMPDRNGLQLAGDLKKRAAGQAILLMSAFTFSIAANDLGSLPVDFVLRKPFSTADLQTALGMLFEAELKTA